MRDAPAAVSESRDAAAAAAFGALHILLMVNSVVVSCVRASNVKQSERKTVYNLCL